MSVRSCCPSSVRAGRPHLYRIAATTPNASQQAAAESEMFRELLNRLVDERLEENAADKAHLTVTPEEGRQRHPPGREPDQAAAEGRHQRGQEAGPHRAGHYRDEIRRQVLEGKLIQLRVRGRVRVTDQDARAAYTHWQKEIEQQHPVDLKIIVLQVPPGSSQQVAAAREALAQEIVIRARRGEDYCALVTQFSQDPSTVNTCGSRGLVPTSALFPQLQAAAASLKPGQTADPIPFTDPMGNTAVLIVQLASDAVTIPPYDKVQDQMMDRAFGEATERQRKLWLTELRRGVYIDVRL